MRLVIFTHSLISDWNHGNAHFLRGVATELAEAGHDLRIYEPRDGWSLQNLMMESGPRAVEDFYKAYPALRSEFYELENLDLDRALEGADAVLVHEWNAHELVSRIGRHRASAGGYRLFFHDTHHRSVTAPETMAAYDLAHYDGVLAYGAAIARIYLQNGWTRAAWTWHEAADTRVFYPRSPWRGGLPPAPDGPASPVRQHRHAGLSGRDEKALDLVWIGNWGDDERTAELREFLIRPVAELGLRARVYGVRYPAEAIAELTAAGIEYGGWLPNFRVPEVFAQARVTVHIPRRPYAGALPGIPTIRPFEALACGIPLISAPWNDCEGLFRPGRDFLTARDGGEMTAQLERVLRDERLARALAASGLETIRSRHTCSHRAAELLGIVETAQAEAA